MHVIRIVVVALVAAAALASSASASHPKRPPHLRLSLVPLQTAQLGPSGAALPIQFDSGTVSNDDVPPPLRKDGRVNGYLLDYGDPFSGGPGVTSIQTQVEQFRSPIAAKKGLRYWRNADKLEAVLYFQVGIAASAHFFKVPTVGSGHFAYVISMGVPNADPLYTVDEEASSGSFVLHATVDAGTESTAEQLAPYLMTRLVHRLRRLLGGHLHGTPAKLPPFPEPGPPAGGPDLSKLVVGSSDFTGSSVVINQGYGIDPAALSTYGIELRPAGPFGDIQQSVSWYGNANEATWQGTVISDVFSQGSGTVDLSAVGDNAHGVILSGTDNGAPASFAFVSMWQGQATDFAIAESSATIQPSAVQTLAQAMANHLNAGLTGLGTRIEPTHGLPGRAARRDPAPPVARIAPLFALPASLTRARPSHPVSAWSLRNES